LIGPLLNRLTGKNSDQDKPVDPAFHFLKNSALLAEVDAPAIELLSSRVVHRRYSRHEMIFREDNPGVCMFVIEQGQVEIFAENEGGDPIPLALLEAGALFGEIAAAFGNKRTASARAYSNDTQLLTVSRFDLGEVNKRYPRDGLHIQKMISQSVVDSLIVTTNQVRELQRQVNHLQQNLDLYERK